MRRHQEDSAQSSSPMPSKKVCRGGLPDAQEVENPSYEWGIDEKVLITEQNKACKRTRFLFLKPFFGGMEGSDI